MDSKYIVELSLVSVEEVNGSVGAMMDVLEVGVREVRRMAENASVVVM